MEVYQWLVQTRNSPGKSHIIAGSQNTVQYMQHTDKPPELQKM